MKASPRILLIRLSSFGDILLTTPLIRLLALRYPGCSLDFVVADRFSPALAHNPHLDRLLLFPRAEAAGLLKKGRLVTRHRLLASFLKTLRLEYYDHILDLHNVTDSAWLALRARGGMRVGHREQLLSLFFTRRCNFPNRNHLAHEYAPQAAFRFAEAAGLCVLPVEGERLRPELFCGEAARSEARVFLKTQTVPGLPLIIFNPGASRQTKQWSEESFIYLGKELLQNAPLQILVLGGPDDQEAMRRIAAGIGDGALAASGLPILTSFALLAEAALVVSVDSAALHAATAFRIPTVALFGPSNPQKFGPPFAECSIFSSGRNCAPCTQRRTRLCPGGCMEEISPEAFLSAALQLLQASGRGRC